MSVGFIYSSCPIRCGAIGLGVFTARPCCRVHAACISDAGLCPPLALLHGSDLIIAALSGVIPPTGRDRSYAISATTGHLPSCTYPREKYLMCTCGILRNVRVLLRRTNCCRGWQ